MTASATTSSPRREPRGRPGGGGWSYGFLLRPRWLLLHVLVALMVFGMLSAALWQLRRLDEKREHNELLTARGALPALDVASLDPAATGDQVDDLEWRQAEARGRYRPVE